MRVVKTSPFNRDIPWKILTIVLHIVFKVMPVVDGHVSVMGDQVQKKKAKSPKSTCHSMLKFRHPTGCRQHK